MAGVFRTLSPGLAVAAVLLVLLAPGAAAARGQIGAWGDGSSGQLGDGARTERLSPVQVQGSHGAGAIAIAAGHSHSLALQDDGTVWAWGYDAYGELGDGTQGDPSCFCRTTPVQVVGLSQVVAIAAGDDQPGAEKRWYGLGLGPELLRTTGQSRYLHGQLLLQYLPRPGVRAAQRGGDRCGRCPQRGGAGGWQCLGLGRQFGRRAGKRDDYGLPAVWAPHPGPGGGSERGNDGGGGHGAHAGAAE